LEADDLWQSSKKSLGHITYRPTYLNFYSRTLYCQSIANNSAAFLTHGKWLVKIMTVLSRQFHIAPLGYLSFIVQIHTFDEVYLKDAYLNMNAFIT